MKTVIFVFVVFTSLLNAQVLRATYEVSYGIFQTMGIADARFETHEDDTYAIRIEARTTGVAKFLSNNRTEMYESRGKIINGKLVPDTYTKIRKTNSDKITKIYTFDHLKKTVFKEIQDQGKTHKEINDFYAGEDILTLFFNVKHYMKFRQNQLLYAIGANKENGRIDVIFPKGDVVSKMKKELGTEEGNFVKVILNDRIFSSANGELLINLNEEGLCEKAILEDVLLFGDIIGKRVK
ncbi:DUF3108 domain-containing protein [Sulfuricurvum sp.]|uniref:DUF3108 domain-containing protein n=1 Tax=Sulfuricurvum sp. TaxID=2025608 RepID=UPI003C58401B